MGDTNSSDATTPESRATARSGTFCWARARMIAVQVTSYPAATSVRKGGGDSGEMWTRAQAARASSAAALSSVLLVMVDATVRLDEAPEARLVDRIQRVDSGPGRERDPVLHGRVRRQDDLLFILLDDLLQLLDQVGALAVVLNEHAAVFEVVHLELRHNGARVDAPGRDVGQVRPRRRRVGVVGLVRIAGALDVPVSLVRHGAPGKVGGRAIREVTDDTRHQHNDHERDGSPPPPHLPIHAPPFVPRRHGLLDGGSVWESNPPPACLEPDTGFEVREAHRVPRRFRTCNYAREKRSECTIPPAVSAPVAVQP